MLALSSKTPTPLFKHETRCRCCASQSPALRNSSTTANVIVAICYISMLLMRVSKLWLCEMDESEHIFRLEGKGSEQVREIGSRRGYFCPAI